MTKTKIKLSSSEEIYSSLNDVVAAGVLRAGDTITFLTDVTVGDQVIITKRCTVDLNGHYLFVVIPAGIIVKDKADVVFINGNIQTASTDQIEDAIISQGLHTMVTLGEGVTMVGRGTAIHARKRGTVTIDGAAVSASGSQPTIYVDDEHSSLVVRKGTIKSVITSAIAVRDGGSAIVETGEISTEAVNTIPEEIHTAVAVSGQGSTFVFNDGSLYSPNTPAVRVSASGRFDVAGGTIINDSYDYPVVEVADGFSAFYVTGGKVCANHTSAILSNKMDYGDVQTIQVSGGKVGAKGDIVQVAGPGDHGVVFSGGAVKGKLPQKYIAIGHKVSGEVDAEGYSEIIVATPDTTTSEDYDNPYFPISDPNVSSNSVDLSEFSPEEAAVIMTSDMLPDPIVPEIPEVPEIDDLPSPEIPDVPQISEDPSKPNKSSKPEKPEISDVPIVPDDVPEITSYSVFIKTKVSIYNTPSRTHRISEWRGALTVYNEFFFSADNEEFVLVSFRIPGSGRIATGYVLLQDLPKD